MRQFNTRETQNCEFKVLPYLYFFYFVVFGISGLTFFGQAMILLQHEINRQSENGGTH